MFHLVEGFAESLDEGDRFWNLSDKGEIDGPFVVEFRNETLNGRGILARDKQGKQWEFLLEDLRRIAHPTFHVAKRDWRKQVKERTSMS